MRLEANELKDQFEILEGDFQELSQNYGYLEKRCNLQEQDREKAHIRIHEVQIYLRLGIAKHPDVRENQGIRGREEAPEGYVGEDNKGKKQEGVRYSG